MPFQLVALGVAVALVGCNSRTGSSDEHGPRAVAATQPKAAVRRWSLGASPPVLEVSTAGISLGWSGFHVDADGSVWQFKHAPAKRFPAAKGAGDAAACNPHELRGGTPELWRCLYADSVFVLELAADDVKELLQAAAETVDGPRIGVGRPPTDAPGDHTIRLTGFATKEGRPIVLGSCVARDQLDSAATRKLFALYRRVAQHVPRFGLDSRDCDMPSLGPEIVPGVRAWFAP